MKHILIIFIAGALITFSCTNNKEQVSSETINQIDSTTNNFVKDSVEILALIRNVTTWADSKDQVGLLPLKADRSNFCIGVDYDLQNQSLRKLTKSTFFTTHFIENYQKIVDRLNQKIINKEIEKFDIAEVPPFSFATDASPWCNCQDNLDWQTLNIKGLNFTNNGCELKWFWKDWKDYEYKVKLIKEQGKWKIDYMEGFDYDEATK